MRLGILADVHGNALALDAVLADAAERRIDRWINLGDCFYGPLDPAATAQRLRDLGAVTVRGNQDRILLEAGEETRAQATFRFVEAALDAAELEWLAALPQTARTGDVLLCHGTPRSDEQPLLEEIGPHGVSLRDGTEIERLLEGAGPEVVLCAHTHVPRTVQLPGGALVVNPGSVGLPAYTDDHPHPHAMEAGSPHARYAVLESRRGAWTVEQIAVPYDWQAAAQQAEKNGRPDWARWLHTGRA